MTIHGLGLAPHKVVREARMCACIMGNLSNRKFSAQMSRGKEAEGHPGTRLPPGLMSLVCCLSYPTSLKPVSQHVPIIYHEPSSSREATCGSFRVLSKIACLGYVLCEDF